MRFSTRENVLEKEKHMRKMLYQNKSEYSLLWWFVNVNGLIVKSKCSGIFFEIPKNSTGVFISDIESDNGRKFVGILRTLYQKVQP